MKVGLVPQPMCHHHVIDHAAKGAGTGGMV